MMKIGLWKKIKEGLAIFVLLMGVVASAHAGGPSVLLLPIEGVTAENSDQCAKIFMEKFRPVLHPWAKVAVHMTKDGSTHQVELRIEPGQVSLSEVESALEGSPFRINREQLEYFSLIRLHLEKFEGHERLVGALAALDGKKLRTRTVEDADGSLWVTLRHPNRNTALTLTEKRKESLISHQDLTRFLSDHQIKLIAIGWGQHQLDPSDAWRGDSFGARVEADGSIPAPFEGVNVSSNPVVRVQASRGKPKSPFIRCQVYPVMEKLFAKESVQSVEITVSLNSESGAHFSSTLSIARNDEGVQPLTFTFSPAKDARVGLRVRYGGSVRATSESMDLVKLCEGKDLTR